MPELYDGSVFGSAAWSPLKTMRALTLAFSFVISSFHKSLQLLGLRPKLMGLEDVSSPASRFHQALQEPTFPKSA